MERFRIFSARRRGFLVGAIALPAALGVLTACDTDHVVGVQPTGGETWGTGTTSHTISVGAVNRSFLLHVPKGSPASSAEANAQPAVSFPLVVVLHGSSGDAESIRASS